MCESILTFERSRALTHLKLHNLTIPEYENKYGVPQSEPVPPSTVSVSNVTSSASQVATSASQVTASALQVTTSASRVTTYASQATSSASQVTTGITTSTTGISERQPASLISDEVVVESVNNEFRPCLFQYNTEFGGTDRQNTQNFTLKNLNVSSPSRLRHLPIQDYTDSQTGD